jgi:hypothetical protein
MEKVNIDFEIEKLKQNEIRIKGRFEKGIVVDSTKMSDYLINCYRCGYDMLVGSFNCYRCFFDEVNEVIVVFCDPDEHHNDDKEYCNADWDDYAVEIIKSYEDFNESSVWTTCNSYVDRSGIKYSFPKIIDQFAVVIDSKKLPARIALYRSYTIASIITD